MLKHLPWACLCFLAPAHAPSHLVKLSLLNSFPFLKKLKYVLFKPHMWDLIAVFTNIFNTSISYIFSEIILTFLNHCQSRKIIQTMFIKRGESLRLF